MTISHHDGFCSSTCSSGLRSALIIVVILTAHSVRAQTVQLPTLRTFHYSGSVLAPDRGTTSLGGVSRGASGYSRRPFGHSSGSTASSSGLAVSPQIIDLDEMDREIRGKSQPSKGQITSPMERLQIGKAMVRRARRLYREGQQSQSFDQYVSAIKLLDGRLQRLAAKEFRRVFGAAADQALLPFQL